MKKGIKKITTIGGGTGQYELLRSLVRSPDLYLRAIVTMADDGGSSGNLRTELGVLPPGDLRQCLVALATIEEPKAIDLMNFRFVDGSYSGENMGNLIFAACEKMWGLEEAIRFLGQLLQVRGCVIPVTFSDVTLVAEMTTRQFIRGEDKIGSADLFRLKSLRLEPDTLKVNPEALVAIDEADVIVIGPGDLHTSIFPNLLVPNISQALQETSACLVYVCNLMTKPGQTDGLSVRGFTESVEKYIHRPFDKVVYNTARPSDNLIEAYQKEGEQLVVIDDNLGDRFVGANLISGQTHSHIAGDTLKRSLVRHDRDALSKVIRGFVS